VWDGNNEQSLEVDYAGQDFNFVCWKDITGTRLFDGDDGNMGAVWISTINHDEMSTAESSAAQA
jgi:hypothetical protein